MVDVGDGLGQVHAVYVDSQRDPVVQRGHDPFVQPSPQGRLTD
jgi:hypothetical protein